VLLDRLTEVAVLDELTAAEERDLRRRRTSSPNPWRRRARSRRATARMRRATRTMMLLRFITRSPSFVRDRHTGSAQLRSASRLFGPPRRPGLWCAARAERCRSFSPGLVRFAWPLHAAPLGDSERAET
jgi:hypothetical protein